MRFMIIEKGSVNAGIFIEFLKRLIKGARQNIFLIVDRGPAHRAKKVDDFVQTLGGKLRLFFLPPYSPDRNPDELVWKHLKADTVGRIAVTSKDDFAKKVREAMSDDIHDDMINLADPSEYEDPASQRAMAFCHVAKLADTVQGAVPDDAAEAQRQHKNTLDGGPPVH